MEPPAPPLTSAHDPLAWHDMGPMEPRTVRRVRRLDLGREPEHLALEVYFRDSHLGPEGPEDVPHEYPVNAAPAPVALRFAEVHAVPHNLPWPACPGALAPAPGVVGHTHDAIHPVVRA